MRKKFWIADLSESSTYFDVWIDFLSANMAKKICIVDMLNMMGMMQIVDEMNMVELPRIYQSIQKLFKHLWRNVVQDVVLMSCVRLDADSTSQSAHGGDKWNLHQIQ